MRNLVIMPTERKTLNLGEYAEEATIIVEETAKPCVTFLVLEKVLHTLTDSERQIVMPLALSILACSSGVIIKSSRPTFTKA